MKRKITALAALLLAALLLLTGCSEVLEAVSEIRSEVTEALPLATAEPAKPAEEKAAQAQTEAPTKKPTKAPTKKPTKAPTETPAPAPAGPITAPQAIADYIFAHGTLPDNFITKEEAEALGWDSTRNYVSDVAPGMSIGGDRFGNYEGLLPNKKGRTFRECDCNYTGGRRNNERIVYSSDGRVWYTKDHYETFTELFPSN